MAQAYPMARDPSEAGLFERDGADILAAAILAAAALPEKIELFGNGFDERRAVGAEADLEIALMGGFGTQAGAGEVGAAQVHVPGVDDDGLGVEARAAADGDGCRC